MNRDFRLPTVSTFAILSLTVAAAGAGIEPAAFTRVNPRTFLHFSPVDGRLSRVYGKAFSAGESPKASAEAFITRFARELMGVVPSDLVESRLAADAPAVQPLMVDPDSGIPKFYALYYTQKHRGLPVYGTCLALLVRNAPGFPLVLANPSVYNLQNFSPPTADQVLSALAIELPGKAPTKEPVLQVYVDGAGPRLAYVYQVDEGTAADGAGHRRLEVIVDALTGGEILTRDRILTHDIVGNVSALATPGWRPDTSYNLPVLTPIPGAMIRIDAVEAAFTDYDGNYAVENLDSIPVVVASRMESETLYVQNRRGEDLLIAEDATAPATVDFFHNSPAVDTGTAQVNALIHSTIIRDWQGLINPAYPSLLRPFVATTNNSFFLFRCNATYDGDSINFYLPSGTSCVNSAYSTVVYHEYGHKIIDDGTTVDPSSAYHEGMADGITIAISDQSIVGEDFLGPGNHIRDGENTKQHPCSEEAHECGKIVAGCIWDTRQELALSDPENGLSVIQHLTINSILLQPRDIEPALTIDFLTLDDDDADILNGTPHYQEIASGFGNHGLDAPTLATMTLSATELAAGQPAGLRVTGASGMTRVYFVYSTTGLSGTVVPQLGVTLALQNPALIGSSNSDGSGTAVLQITVPGGTEGTDVWMQAAHLGSVSNVVATEVR